MRGQPEQRAGPDDLPRHRDRQVILAQVQYIGTDRTGNVGPVVHREQRGMPVAGTAERGKKRHLVRGLKALLAQLDDVHAGPEDRIKEPGQVSLPLPRVGAQVQPGGGQPGAQVTGGTVIGAGCQVSAGASIDGSVLFDGAAIGAGAVITGSVIGTRARIGEGAVIDGAVIGDGAHIAEGNELRSGLRVWPGTRLGPTSVRFSTDA